MKSRRALLPVALAAWSLVAAPSRAENPPYAIQANPPGSVAEGTPARFKPVRSGNDAILNQVCKLEIWPDGAAHGATWIGAPDSSCSRENAVTLAPGRYRLKLGVTWQGGGSNHSATAEAPYEVRFVMPPYKIAVTPPLSVLEGTPVKIKPLATGVTAISQQVCKLEVWPEGRAQSAVWTGPSDPGCSREEAVNLPSGRYVVKLGIRWQAAGGISRSATAETPYEVTPEARFVMPPYKIAVTPPLSVLEGTPVKIKPLATGVTAISQQVCKLEVWPEGRAQSAVWTGPSDPGCSREEAVNLPSGRYVVKLGIGWQAAGGISRTATAETPYEVTSNEKLQMTKCNFSPARPMAGRAASVSWDVRNLSGFPLGPFRVSILVSHLAVDSFTVVALAAGATLSRTASWTPQAPGKFRTQCTVDPENAVHEGQEPLKNNTIFSELTVVSADVLKPVIVLGTLNLGPIWWKQDYTVCNVDVDADYKNDPGCPFPCVGGYNGVPSRDFTTDRVSADGSGISPGCPGGLISRAAFKPGTAEGGRSQYQDETYTLKVTATKDGRSAEASVPVRVPFNCGMFSIPICVEMEGGKGR